MIRNIKFKAISSGISDHPLEKRGFVTVPFDYKNPESETIEIFYRLIPAYDSTVSDTSKPIIVVINGGPGIASSVYRPLDFDYENTASPKNGSLNRFKFLLKEFRILIVDQRGTDGQSAPIDIDDPSLNVNAVAKYFSSDSQARDYLAVIETVIPQGEDFFIIAQSYGGMVGMQYLSIPETRKPKGIVFSCSALPYETIFEACALRRKEQLALNVHLKNEIPDFESELELLKKHLVAMGLDPRYINSLYTLLGKDVTGKWELPFMDQLVKMRGQTKSEIENEIKNNLGSVNILNYILSSANFSPGHTDRTIAVQTSKSIPFEPWMIDENWMLMQTGQDGTWREKLIRDMDQSPPPPTSFIKLDKLKRLIAQNQLLFTAADNDAFVPSESYLKEIQKFQVEGHTQVKTLPGGHHAIFLEKGNEVFCHWINTL